MTRFALALAAGLTLTAGGAQADEEKARSCGYQGDVVAAIQQARLDRVRERDVPDALAAQDTGWPERYDKSVPLITPWVYDLPRKQLREDLRAVWVELCLQQ